MELSKEEHAILYDWITFNLIPIKSFNNKKTSYGLKHIFENDDCGFYVTNDDFKSVMVEYGFKVQNPNSVNWVFNISSRSPAFKK